MMRVPHDKYEDIRKYFKNNWKTILLITLLSVFFFIGFIFMLVGNSNKEQPFEIVGASMIIIGILCSIVLIIVHCCISGHCNCCHTYCNCCHNQGYTEIV